MSGEKEDIEFEALNFKNYLELRKLLGWFYNT